LSWEGDKKDISPFAVGGLWVAQAQSIKSVIVAWEPNSVSLQVDHGLIGILFLDSLQLPYTPPDET
jgi:hypothetical protein